MGAHEILMGTVELDESTRNELARASAYGAKVLKDARDAVEIRMANRTRVTSEDVLMWLDDMITDYTAGADPMHWSNKARELDAQAGAGWRDEATGLVSGGLVTDDKPAPRARRPVKDEPAA